MSYVIEPLTLVVVSITILSTFNGTEPMHIAIVVVLVLLIAFFIYAAVINLFNFINSNDHHSKVAFSVAMLWILFYILHVI